MLQGCKHLGDRDIQHLALKAIHVHADGRRHGREAAESKHHARHTVDLGKELLEHGIKLDGITVRQSLQTDVESRVRAQARYGWRHKEVYRSTGDRGTLAADRIHDDGGMHIGRVTLRPMRQSDEHKAHVLRTAAHHAKPGNGLNELHARHVTRDGGDFVHDLLGPRLDRTFGQPHVCKHHALILIRQEGGRCLFEPHPRQQDRADQEQGT